jgi:regulator of protease activity HflC (stomatin/prohibitin superfamily)
MEYIIGFIVVVVVLFIFIFVISGIKIVKQAEVIVVERLGKYNRTLQSGVNVILPFFERPRKIAWRYVKQDLQGHNIVLTLERDRIDLRETLYDFPKQSVITKDNANIEINALLYFQITDPKKSVYEIANLPDAIEKLTQTTLRNVIGELDLDETLTSRDTINQKLRIILDEATDKWGVKVNRVELQDIIPPADVRQAMEKQMKAERERREKILIAEGEKRSNILQAEGLREARIQEAEGTKRAAILSAEGDAEARLKKADAEAEALKKLTVALGEKSNPAQYLITMEYLKSLQEMASGKENKTVFIPYEATGILSSLGGIKELLGKGT